MNPPALRAPSAGSLCCLVVLAALLAGCQARRATAQIPAPTSMPVSSAARMVWNGSYANDIQPIFDRNCLSCHGSDRAENGLKLTSHADVMRGTR